MGPFSFVEYRSRYDCCACFSDTCSAADAEESCFFVDPPILQFTVRIQLKFIWIETYWALLSVESSRPKLPNLTSTSETALPLFGRTTGTSCLRRRPVDCLALLAALMGEEEDSCSFSPMLVSSTPAAAATDDGCCCSGSCGSGTFSGTGSFSSSFNGDVCSFRSTGCSHGSTEGAAAPHASFSFAAATEFQPSFGASQLSVVEAAAGSGSFHVC